MEDLLCKKCWHTLFNTEAAEQFWKRQIDSISYTTSWRLIADSARAGCNWCSYQLSCLPAPGNVNWPEGWFTGKELTVWLEEALVMDDASPKGLNVCQLDYGSEESPREWHVEFDLCIDTDDGVEKPVTARPLQLEVNSAEAYSQIQRWYEDCGQHRDCAVPSKTCSLPSRVIEIEAPEDSDKIHLHLTEDFQPPYLALSYCWGRDQPYVLTSANLLDLKESIDIGRLPATIRDAIEVSKSLGIKYVWVDALCIMQNTSDLRAMNDMDMELAKMDQIYRNSCMTIVAACAASVNRGFLERRSATSRRQFDIPCRLGHGEFFVAHISEHQQYNDQSEPINSRAWTFQEQLLSPRLLIYASHTLQWQCRTLTSNLGNSYHAPNLSAAPRPPPPTLSFGGPESVLKKVESVAPIPHGMLQSWFRVVSAFSARAISLPSDKLPAISALAATYYPTFGPKYYAGIWEKSAVQQLCWRKESSKDYLKRPDCVYRAPSWSWAALDGAVYFPSFLEREGGSVCSAHPKFKILEWQTSLKSHGVPYGEVTAGMIVLSAVCRHGNLELSSPTPHIRFVDADSTAEGAKPQTAQAHIDVFEDNFHRRVHCIALYVVEGAKDLRVGGLILYNDSQATPVFRRIGLFNTQANFFDELQVRRIEII